ncbi:MAG: hypothetical protein WDO06_10080 [Actinomycetota bacterium]
MVSYGGSSLIAIFLALGFVLGTARRDPSLMRTMERAASE